jgi:hypothetical protein
MLRPAARPPFSPLYALGTTVDRVPSNATDTFFRPDQLSRFCRPDGDRQLPANTDCSFKPGTGIPRHLSDPLGKGYFTGNATRRGRDPALVWLLAPAPRLHPKRRYGIRRILSLDDGDLNTYGRAIPISQNVLLAKMIHFSQWVVIDLGKKQDVMRFGSLGKGRMRMSTRWSTGPAKTQWMIKVTASGGSLNRER